MNIRSLVVTTVGGAVALLAACGVDTGQGAPSPGVVDSASSVATKVEPSDRNAAALNAAVGLSATVGAKKAPAGLVPSDFSVKASLDEYVTFVDDLVDNGSSAKILRTGRSVHLVTGGTAYKSVVFLRSSEGKAVFSEFHGDDLGRPLDETLEELSKTERADDGAFFFVIVPNLHLELIGYRVGGDLKLASLRARPDLSLLAGSPQRATSLFASLAGPARRIVSQAQNLHATEGR
jgi:hypothetical protein